MEKKNKIDFNKFIDYLYTAMNGFDIYVSDIMDVIEIARIIYASKEFEYVSSKLDFHAVEKESLEKHRFTTYIDEDGFTYFEVPEEERKKITEEDPMAYHLIEQAVDKRDTVKYLEDEYYGTLKYAYNNSDGLYNLRQMDSCLYTDGKITDILYSDKEEVEPPARTVSVEGSTFSIFTYQTDNGLYRVEVRGDCKGDYELLETELDRLFNGNEESFSEISDDHPIVFKYKIH